MKGRWDYGLQQSMNSVRQTQLARPMLFSTKNLAIARKFSVRINVLFCMMQGVQFRKLDKEPGCFERLQGNYQE